LSIKKHSFSDVHKEFEDLLLRTTRENKGAQVDCFGLGMLVINVFPNTNNLRKIRQIPCINYIIVENRLSF